MTKRALLTSINLIGDALYVGPVAKKWYDEQGQDYGEIHLLTIQNHARSVYDGMGIPWKVIFEREGDYDTELVFDVSRAFQISDRKKCHLVQSYAELVGVNGDGLVAKPNYQPPEMDIGEDKKGLALISMFSMSCASRENPPRPPNKMLPWDKWKPLLKTLWEAYGREKVKMIGSKTDILPEEAALELGIVETDYMLGVPIPEQAVIMKYGKCLVTVDNGMGHLAAAVGLNEFLIVPGCLALHYIVPWGHDGVRTVHVEPTQVNAEYIDSQLKSAIKDWEGQRNDGTAGG